MKGPYNGEPGTDWQLGPGPFCFSGPPTACRGELGLINDSDYKLRVRQLETRAVPRPRKDHQALPPGYIQLSARIRPHDTARSRATLMLTSDTAPGCYQGTVVCGKQKERLEVEVLAHRELLVEPSHLRLHGHSGQVVEQRLTLSNRGNVPIELRDVSMVWLEEVNWAGRTLVDTLRATSAEDGYEEFANRLVQEFRRSLVVPARIRFRPSLGQALAPGQCIERSLSLTLPPGLKKGRRYLGFIKVDAGRIWLRLYCNANETAPKRS
ncbi:hypothetical protein [Marinobacter sp. SS21]|uniref:hypothetical protein n=1 Tax=Marinobacter sp. SS21 TaxID=2979460 RepID=UPI00232DB2FF|nr:hypothetical protein [Marinobacter sp. SS21]MDC0664126.1 hypothetical protein [Marinobacter sp. SS21]